MERITVKEFSTGYVEIDTEGKTDEEVEALAEAAYWKGDVEWTDLDVWFAGPSRINKFKIIGDE